jgi:hypothetical protein
MAVALGGYVRELKRRLVVGTRRRHPMAEWPTALDITRSQEMIARSAVASSSLRPTWGDQVPQRIPAGRKQRYPAPGRSRLACLGDSGVPTLAANPDAADLRVGRVDAPKRRGERAI